MRKRTCVALVGLLVTASGCKLTLPSGFPIVPVTPTGSTKPGGPTEPAGTGACAERFVKLDKNADKALSLDEYVAKGGEPGDRDGKDDDARNFLALDQDGDRKLSAQEYAAGCDDGGTKPTAKPTAAITTPPTPPPGAGCDDAFAKYDRDQDGAWSIDEFLGWDGSRPRPKTPCGGGGIVSSHGGGLIAVSGGGTIVAAGGGSLLPKRVLQQAIISNDGGVLISNNSGGLIAAGNAGGLISSGPNGAMIAPMPFPCPPDDPKFRFAQFDHDGDGKIAVGEFCNGPLKRPHPQPTGGPEPWPTGGPYPEPTPGPYGCEDGFFRSDRDGDGLVSPEEFKLSYVTPDVVYSNNGGNEGAWISAPAIDPYVIFKSQDQDGDGYLSLEESCGYDTYPVETPPPADWCGFYKVDADGDGEATWEEYVGWSLRNEFPAPSKDVVYTRFASQDFDQNWVITQDEYCGFVEPEPYPYPTPTPVASWYPSPKPTWYPTPTPAPTAAPGSACLDAVVAAGAKNGPITFDAYAKARFDQVRFFQQPSDEDVKAMLENYASEARAYDRDNDGRLSYDEAKALCVSQGN